MAHNLPLWPSLTELNCAVTQCRRCPRLVAYRESTQPRKSYQNQTYWKRPVPGYGSPNAWFLIVGLAPAAHGGNRTGRLFTGDDSARFLFKALYKTGLANQPTSESLEDNLQLLDGYMTAAVKCAPPKDKPTRQEFTNCHFYLENELLLLPNLKCILILGRIAFDAIKSYAKLQGHATKDMQFAHGAIIRKPNLPTLYCSYHPSPRNVNTGLLTEPMLLSLLSTLKQEQKP